MTYISKFVFHLINGVLIMYYIILSLRLSLEIYRIFQGRIQDLEMGGV